MRKKAVTLTAEQIQSIARRVRDGELQGPLAAEFGVVQSTISHILRRKHRVGLVLVGANRECSECSAPFQPSRAKQMVCSRNCMVERARRMNAERRVAANRRALETKRALREQAKSVPCMDCGGSFPHYCMDFDHRDPTTKSPRLKLQGVRHRSMIGLTLSQLREEIQKCDVVCANCHRIRTHNGMKSGLIKPNPKSKTKRRSTLAKKRIALGQMSLYATG